MRAEIIQRETAGTDRMTAILAAVKSVLRTRHAAPVPEAGIDLMFDAGVVARCRACNVSWHVARTQYKSPHWWACPSGCHRRGAA